MSRRPAGKYPLYTTRCYACSEPAVGLRDRRLESGGFEGACARHADPSLPAYRACQYCSGPLRRNSHIGVHVACLKADR